MTTVYLVRHAQSLPLPEQMEPEWRLSPRGEEQARALVPVLGALGIQRAYTSPFARCQLTLAPFAAATGVPLCVHDGLRERRIVAQWVADFRDVWQRSWSDFAFALEGCESSWTCRARMIETLAALAAMHPGETIAAGSHGNSIGLFLHSLEETFGVAEASALRTPELLKVVHDGRRFHWDKSFRPGPAFDKLATHFRQTPGVVA